jgi:CMP-N-acetylneuraminic acid synthetase
MVDNFKKKGKMTAVVAVREGSQRVPNKNVRSFADTNLLELKIKVLKNCKLVDEIIINSDSKDMLEIGSSFGVKTKLRDGYYASNEASNSEFHGHIAETTDTDFIFLAPVCSPFISSETHDEAIEQFLNSHNDSLTSTHDVVGHLWLDNKPLNYRLDKVPNSQDLPKIKMLNYGISIIEKTSMQKLNALIGHVPGFVDLEYIESIDINTLEEFNIAELLYKNNLIPDLISYEL